MSFLSGFGKPQTFVQVGAFTGDDDLIAACRRFGFGSNM